MALTPEQLAQTIQRAKVLCSPNADKGINNMAKKYQSTGGYDPDPSSFGDAIERQVLGNSYQPNFNYAPITEIPQSNFNNSKLPNAIKESFMQKPPQYGVEHPVSVLDSIPGINQLKEERQPTSPNYNTVPSSIDYGIIKAIVNECLSQYLGSGQLNEGSLKTIQLKEGKIKLVDNKGNVYSATLEKTGNINDKKK